MGNLAGFSNCSNICTCTQKNILISSEFVVNGNETTKANINNSNKKTEEYKNKSNALINSKRLIKFSNLESVNSLTPLLIKIDTEYKRLNFLTKSRTNNEKNENLIHVNSNRTNQTKRNNLLRKMTEKNNKETCDEQEIPNIKNSNNSNSKNQDDNSKRLFLYSTREISRKEENFLFNFFKHHFLFMEFNNEFHKNLINIINIISIENDTCIFKKGEKSLIFFIIKSGEVILKNDLNEKKVILTQGESFGELALINSEYKRTYSVYSKGKIELYSLTYDIFHELLNLKKDNLYNYNRLNSQEIVEKKLEHLSHFYLFKKIDDNEKKKIFELSRAFEIIEENLLININIKKENKNPFFSTNKDILYIIDGEIEEKYNDNDYIISYEKGRFAGYIFTFFKTYDKELIEIINKSNKTVILLIPEKAFIESMGIDYKYKILFDLFLDKINKIDIISSLINESKAKEEYQLLFDAFNINEYKTNEIIFPKSQYENKKLLLLLYGELIKDNKIILTSGQMIGEHFINSIEE